MTNEVQAQVFDYSELDVGTADFLRRKESNMREIVGKAYTELGRELKDAQDILAKNGYGCFQAWAESIGIKRNKVYDLIRRYETIVRISDEQTRELIEDLPISLSYEIAKPSAESSEAKAQAKSEVLDGSIATLKEYRERIAELEAQALESKRSEEIALRQLERAEDELAIATKPETVVIEKEVERIVEVDNTDYSAVEKLKRYEERFGALENYSDRVRASNVDDVTTSIISFNMAVRDFIKRHAYLIKYQDTVGHIDKITQREYVEAVSALKSIAADFGKVTGAADYVDVEFSEV